MCHTEGKRAFTAVEFILPAGGDPEWILGQFINSCFSPFSACYFPYSLHLPIMKIASVQEQLDLADVKGENDIFSLLSKQ
jgi:hypothetical protein